MRVRIPRHTHRAVGHLRSRHHLDDAPRKGLLVPQRGHAHLGHLQPRRRAHRAGAREKGRRALDRRLDPGHPIGCRVARPAARPPQQHAALRRLLEQQACRRQDDNVNLERTGRSATDRRGTTDGREISREIARGEVAPGRTMVQSSLEARRAASAARFCLRTPPREESSSRAESDVSRASTPGFPCVSSAAAPVASSCGDEVEMGWR